MLECRAHLFGNAPDLQRVVSAQRKMEESQYIRRHLCHGITFDETCYRVIQWIAGFRNSGFPCDIQHDASILIGKFNIINKFHQIVSENMLQKKMEALKEAGRLREAGETVTVQPMKKNMKQQKNY